MENIYLFFIVLLFALAISDLIVGVSNDAVNFLNSAIGSRVAPRYIIMIIASVGVLVGATFSDGMMEVARKGIFHPEHFYFTQIMWIFLAVMITDILLLDFFNTVGLPTSTTVSIVFELLGAAVAVSIVKLTQDQVILVNGVEKIAEMSDYINSGKALAIISGILLSVVVAFSIGFLAQWISRIIFSFNFKKSMKYFGSIWGGLAITAITFFILIKGAKGASFMSGDTQAFIKENTNKILLISFISWAVLLQILNLLFKTNVLKVIVLIGTFALAMAFAGNDLVNFIGVPLAGFESFKAFKLNGGTDILMGSLSGKVATPPIFLLIAGGVMVATLWISKKARTVTETELNLSRQDEGAERFGSSFFARLIVRRTMKTGTIFQQVVPERISNSIRKRFDQTEYKKSLSKEKNPPMFDLIRASVNLTIASILIALGTSLKLPLSTTYVTFMVAMGSSLADGAWGRESAVYRITGVITVIGGWFFTAFIAFTVAFLLALFMIKLKLIGVIILANAVIAVIINTTLLHKKREKSKEEEKRLADQEKIEEANVISSCTLNVKESLAKVEKIFRKTIKGLTNEDRKLLKSLKENVLELNADAKKLKYNVHKVLRKLDAESLETGPYYVQVIDYLREIAHSLTFVTNPSFDHIDNNHKGLIEEQVIELTTTAEKLSELFNLIGLIIKTNDFSQNDKAYELQAEILNYLNKIRKNQVKRIKKNETGTKNSILFLAIVNESKNLVLQSINLLKAQRDFIQNK